MPSEDLKHIIEWFNNNFLYLNYSKTKVMLTGTHQRLALVNSFTVRAGDTVPSRVYLKYLGVMLDPYLSWNDHIDYIGRKISAKLRKARKVIPRESCLTLNNLTLTLKRSPRIFGSIFFGWNFRKGEF